MSQGFGDASSVARMNNNRDNSVDNSQGGGGLRLFKDDPLKPLTNLGGGGGQTPKSGAVLYPIASMTPAYNNSGFGGAIGIPSLYSGLGGGATTAVAAPETVAQKRKREEAERLERELQQERGKLVLMDADHAKTIHDLKEKNKRDLQTIEDSQKSMLAMIIQEKEKTMEAHQEAIARERLKMDVHH